MKRIAALLSLCAAGCAAPTRPPAAPAKRPEPAASPLAPWRQYVLPLVGLRARFEALPREQESSDPGHGILQYTGFSLDRKGTVLSCKVIRLNVGHLEREGLLHAAVASLGPGAHIERSLVKNGFYGVQVAGRNKDGDRVDNRYFVVGDSVVMAEVAAKGHPIDERRAKRFLDGCDFSIPWRVAAWMDESMTFAVPVNAVEHNIANEQTHTRIRRFDLGGVDQLSFLVASTPVDAASARNADALLDRAVSRLVSSGYHVLRTSQVEHNGVRGRELMMDGKRQLRCRMFVVGEHLYQVRVLASRSGALGEPSALRFLDSVTWNHAG